MKKENMMARSNKSLQRRGGKALLPPTLMLAFWRLRKTWGLLLVTGAGMIAAVMLVCSVPLYSQVSMTAGLRSILNAAPQNADLLVYSIGEQVSTPIVSKVTQELNQEFNNQLGPYLQPPQFSVQTNVYFVDTATKNKKGVVQYSDTLNQIQLVGASMNQAASHVKLLRGRLPLSNSTELEVALPADSATGLTPTIGSVFYVAIAFNQIPVKRVIVHLPVHVVGLISDTATSDPYWHQIGFKPTSRGNGPLGPPGSIFTGVVSNDTFLSILTQTSNEPALNGLVMEQAVSYYWYYRLDVNHIAVGNLDTIDQGSVRQS
jgi:putative ABC transport system permease protein